MTKIASEQILNSPILIIKIGELAYKNNIELYLVGGFVRDQILGSHSTDIDIVVVGDAIEFAKIAYTELNGFEFAFFKTFGTSHFNCGPFILEFASARSESYQRNSRKPHVEKTDLITDLSRRDFTINAMAKNLLTNQIIDPFDGLQDLKNKMIKTPLDPDKTFDDDPLRMFRAIRFASRFKFTIEEKTWIGILQNKHRVVILSSERILEELRKIEKQSDKNTAFKLLLESNLLENFFYKKNIDSLKLFTEKINFADFSLEDIFSAYFLLLKLSDSEIKKSLQLLKASNEFIAYCASLKQAETFLQNFLDSDKLQGNYYRLLFNLGETYQRKIDFFARYFIFFTKESLLVNLKDQLLLIDETNHFSKFKLALNGEEIKSKFALEEGKKLGDLIKLATEAILDDKLKNTVPALEDFFRSKL
jgi:tRNA nucleotidyltransferase/poly(A) polymerase